MRWPSASILCYHAITSTDCGSDSVVNIPLDEITTALDQLRLDREIIPLGELLRRHANGKSVAGLAAITFDDAYASVGLMLSPWLHSRRIPYTLFVTTAASASGAPFWWDRVDDLYSRVAPEQWRAFEDRVGVPDAYRAGHQAEGPRRPLRQYILARHHGRWPAALSEPLAELEQLAGSTTKQRPMTFDEIDSLTEYEGLEVGIHTITHPVLPSLPDDELIDEVRSSFEQLRARYSRTIPVLAIPFGLFDDRTLRLASQAGAVASLTLTNRLMGRSSAYGIPRLSMTRHSPVWKQRLRWTGVVQTARDVMAVARRHNPYPALPSAGS